MQFVYVHDLVDVCLKVIDEPHAVGNAFNVANLRPITQLEVVQVLADTAGKTPQFVRLPRGRILQAGGHPTGPNLYFGMFYISRPSHR